MKRVSCCVLLLCANLPAQTSAGKPRLATTLASMCDAATFRPDLSQRLADEMMLLADRDRRPSRSTVAKFTDELTAALAGRKVPVTVLESAIRDLLLPSGTTIRPASRLRTILANAGVGSAKTQLVIRRTIAVGEEVRGPDDTPVTPVK